MEAEANCLHGGHVLGLMQNNRRSLYSWPALAQAALS
jgi:hypothetical protein